MTTSQHHAPAPVHPNRVLAVLVVLLVASASLSLGIGSRGYWDEAELPPEPAGAFARLVSPLDWGEEPPLRDALVALVSAPLPRPGPATSRAPSLLGALLLVGLAASEAYRREGKIGALAAAALVLASPLVFFEAQWGGSTMLAGALAATAGLATFDLAFHRPSLDATRPSKPKAAALVLLAGLAGGGDALLVAIAPAVVAAFAGDREDRKKRLSALAAPAGVALVLFAVGALRAVLGGRMFPPRAPFEWTPAIVTAAGMAFSLPLLHAYVRHRRLRETSFEAPARAIAFVTILVLSAAALRDPAAGLIAAHLPAVVLVSEAAIEARAGAIRFDPGARLAAPAAFAGGVLLVAGAGAAIFAANAGAIPTAAAVGLFAVVLAAAAVAVGARPYAARLAAIGGLAVVLGPFLRAEVLPLLDWSRAADDLARRAVATAAETGRPLVTFALDSRLVERALDDLGAPREATADPVVLFAKLGAAEPVAALLGQETFARLRQIDPTFSVAVRHVARRDGRPWLLVSNRPGT